MMKVSFENMLKYVAYNIIILEASILTACSV